MKPGVSIAHRKLLKFGTVWYKLDLLERRQEEFECPTVTVRAKDGLCVPEERHVILALGAEGVEGGVKPARARLQGRVRISPIPG